MATAMTRKEKRLQAKVRRLEETIEELTTERDEARKALDEAIDRNAELRGRLADVGGYSGAWLKRARAELWDAITLIDNVSTRAVRAQKRRAKDAK